MADRMSAEQRRRCMSRISAKDTGPEVRLRKRLYALGYRYRVNVRGMAGTPDIVLSKWHTCIFVNGCFWHGHEGCGKYKMPKTRTEYWRNKIETNKARDLRDWAYLETRGWNVLVVWECELKDLDKCVDRVVKELEINRWYVPE